MQELKFENLPSAVGQLNNKLDRIERLLTEKVNPQKNELDKPIAIKSLKKFLKFSKLKPTEYIRSVRRKTILKNQVEADPYLVKRKG